jgi:hypothetical protein
MSLTRMEAATSPPISRASENDVMCRLLMLRGRTLPPRAQSHGRKAPPRLSLR